MRLRSGLLTLASVFAGSLAFVFIALCTVVLLADHDSGAAFSGVGGATPATASSGSDQLALRQRSAAGSEESKSGDPAVALVAKARIYFLTEILRH
jgi:hypothetical protein